MSPRNVSSPVQLLLPMKLSLRVTAVGSAVWAVVVLSVPSLKILKLVPSAVPA